jgi:hypothetical protein
MFELFWGWLRALFRSRAELVIENLALRQQAAVLKRKRPRPALENVDRAFWVALDAYIRSGRRFWSSWSRRPLFGGIEPDSRRCGVGNRGGVEERAAHAKSGSWSGGWRMRTGRGKRRAFMPSC